MVATPMSFRPQYAWGTLRGAGAVPKTRTFALYLAKAGVKDFDELLTEKAKERISGEEATVRESTSLGAKAKAYVFVNVPSRPNWLADLGLVFDGIPDVKNRSSSCERSS